MPERKTSIIMIVLAGLLVGTLDIAAASLDYYINTGKGPENVLRYIASGVFGKNAFSSGDYMMAWGLLFHFIIAFSFTLFFYWLYKNFRVVSKNPVPAVLLYGVFMWAVTTKIVIPLSHTPPPPAFQIWKALKSVLILILMISLPLMLIMRRHFRAESGH